MWRLDCLGGTPYPPLPLQLQPCGWTGGANSKLRRFTLHACKSRLHGTRNQLTQHPQDLLILAPNNFSLVLVQRDIGPDMVLSLIRWSALLQQHLGEGSRIAAIFLCGAVAFFQIPVDARSLLKPEGVCFLLDPCRARSLLKGSTIA